MQWMRLTPWIAMLGIARIAAAQQPAACGFERCGLIVVGPSAVLAAPIDSGDPRSITWYFVPYIPELDVATGSPSREYHAARRLYQMAAVPSAIGIPAVLGVVHYISTSPEERPWSSKTESAVLGVVLGAELIGGPIRARAAERLSRAAWLHSRPDVPSPSAADGCSYDRCALRYRYRYWSSRLVQGLDGRPVASPRELFAGAGDSTRAHYERYLQLKRGSRWRGPLLLTAVFGGFGAMHSSDENVRSVGLGVIFVGYALGHLSLGSEAQERAELEKAIWLYNRDLAAGR